MSMVQASRGVVAPADSSSAFGAMDRCKHGASNPRRQIGRSMGVDGRRLLSHSNKIEAVFPIFQGFNAHIKVPGGFRLANPASERVWMTPNGKANFMLFPGLDEDKHQNNPEVLWLSTLRSHDQYNSTITATTIGIAAYTISATCCS